MRAVLVAAIKAGLSNAVNQLHQANRGSCVASGCPNDAIAKGFCNAHYLRSRKGADMVPPVQAMGTTCVDCGVQINAKGGWMRCAKHFKIARQRTVKAALVGAMGGCCQNCKGVFEPAVYDFHHVHAKEGDPSRLIGNASIQKIAEELEKCVLLCANCHRIEHAK